ncbi:hypothetical protein P3S68_032937 [Capsicum galapagoense]
MSQFLLVLKDPRNSNRVEISAPKLKSFVFLGNIHFIHMKNVPLLSYVSYEPTEFSAETKHGSCQDVLFYSCSRESLLESIDGNVLDGAPVEAIPNVRFVDNGAPAEIQLIKVLLAKSPVLVKMVIEPRGMEVKKSLEVLLEIKRFKRASSKAKVVYTVD